jgi:hypothetical protein
MFSISMKINQLVGVNSAFYVSRPHSRLPAFVALARRCWPGGRAPRRGSWAAAAAAAPPAGAVLGLPPDAHLPGAHVPASPPPHTHTPRAPCTHAPAPTSAAARVPAAHAATGPAPQQLTSVPALRRPHPAADQRPHQRQRGPGRDRRGVHQRPPRPGPWLREHTPPPPPHTHTHTHTPPHTLRGTGDARPPAGLPCCPSRCWASPRCGGLLAPEVCAAAAQVWTNTWIEGEFKGPSHCGIVTEVWAKYRTYTLDWQPDKITWWGPLRGLQRGLAGRGGEGAAGAAALRRPAVWRLGGAVTAAADGCPCPSAPSATFRCRSHLPQQQPLPAHPAAAPCAAH